MEQRELAVRARAGAALCFVCAVCSCAPSKKLFDEGETLYLNGEYSRAEEVFKQRLLQAPDDAGAHFYLGTCYLNAAVVGHGVEKNWLGIAQGELETALSLFERNGKISPVPRFDATYFEMICHLNQAKICLMLLDEVANTPRTFRGLNAQAVIPRILQKCIEQADAAERVSPGAPEVVTLRQLIKDFAVSTNPRAAPTRTAPAPSPSA